MDLISVLMPVYNVELYVEEAIRSILLQTYTNFELIIVDDCSTDNTWKKVCELSKTDDRIRIFRNEKNCKICQTLNRAWKEAKGNYIARMDGDDISIPERLEVLKKYLDEHEEVDLVGSQLATIDEKGRVVSRKKYLRTNQFIKKGNKYISSVSHIWMARRNVYQSLNGYREIPYAEDYDFLLRCELKGFILSNVEQYLYMVRIRQGNTVSANGLVQKKTVRYIKNLHKKEIKNNKDLFLEKDLLYAVACSMKQKKRYQTAAEYLNVAVLNKKCKWKRIINTLKAMFFSKEIIWYLAETIIVRILIYCEDEKYPRKDERRWQ